MARLIATSSAPVREAPKYGSDLVTELIVGERVEVVNEAEGWLEVVVPDHATHLDERGYPGWMEPDKLLEVPDWSPTHKVVSENIANLPLGALLEERGGGLYLPDGSPGEIAGDKVLPIHEAHSRSPTDIAKDLLGLPYRWGGTDSTRGMDCSGLVYRVMQLLAIPIPRDADDQFEKAPLKSRESWKNARANDLVFFGKESITHVGFYLGDGTYISEHGAGGTIVRGIEEDPYLGFARYPPC